MRHGDSACALSSARSGPTLGKQVRKAGEKERELRVCTCDVELNVKAVMPGSYYEDGNYEL